MLSRFHLRPHQSLECLFLFPSVYYHWALQRAKNKKIDSKPSFFASALAAVVIAALTMSLAAVAAADYHRQAAAAATTASEATSASAAEAECSKAAPANASLEWLIAAACISEPLLLLQSSREAPKCLRHGGTPFCLAPSSSTWSTVIGSN